MTSPTNNPASVNQASSLQITQQGSKNGNITSTVIYNGRTYTAIHSKSVKLEKIEKQLLNMIKILDTCKEVKAVRYENVRDPGTLGVRIGTETVFRKVTDLSSNPAFKPLFQRINNIFTANVPTNIPPPTPPAIASSSGTSNASSAAFQSLKNERREIISLINELKNPALNLARRGEILDRLETLLASCKNNLEENGEIPAQIDSNSSAGVILTPESSILFLAQKMVQALRNNEPKEAAALIKNLPAYLEQCKGKDSYAFLSPICSHLQSLAQEASSTARTTSELATSPVRSPFRRRPRNQPNSSSPIMREPGKQFRRAQSNIEPATSAQSAGRTAPLESTIAHGDIKKGVLDVASAFRAIGELPSNSPHRREAIEEAQRVLANLHDDMNAFLVEKGIDPFAGANQRAYGISLVKELQMQLTLLEVGSPQGTDKLIYAFDNSIESARYIFRPMFEAMIEVING